jgi:hypothetical protein
MGLLGQQTHPEVVAAVKRAIADITATGTPAGVNAFDPVVAKDHITAGITFVLVGADVALLARASEQLADDYLRRTDAGRLNFVLTRSIPCHPVRVARNLRVGTASQRAVGSSFHPAAFTMSNQVTAGA